MSPFVHIQAFAQGRDLLLDVGSLVGWALPYLAGQIHSPLTFPQRVRAKDFLEWKVVLGIHGGSETKDNHLGETQRVPSTIWNSCSTGGERLTEKGGVGFWVPSLLSCPNLESMWAVGPLGKEKASTEDMTSCHSCSSSPVPVGAPGIGQRTRPPTCRHPYIADLDIPNQNGITNTLPWW